MIHFTCQIERIRYYIRKTYDKAFKIEIAKKIAAQKTSVTALAAENNISRLIVSRWVSEFNRYGNQAFNGKGKRLPDKAKQYALEAEVKRLKEKNEVLKKFAAFVEREKS